MLFETWTHALIYLRSLCFFLFQHLETLYSLLSCPLSILVFFLFQHLETLYSLLTCLLSILVFFFVSTPSDVLLVVDLSLLNPCVFLSQHLETLYSLLTCPLSILVFFLFQHLETLCSLLTCLFSIFVFFFVSTPRHALLVVEWPSYGSICFYGS